MTNPWLRTGPVRDPQLQREGLSSAGGYVVEYDSIAAVTIEKHRCGQVYVLLVASQGTYQGYIKLERKLTRNYSRSSNRAVCVIQS